MTTGRRVYIIGFMGSGKSTVSKKLAATLDWEFIDLDKEIERNAGKPIRMIFSASGEDHFRKLEEKTLFNLNINTDTVISTGGGTPCYGSNIDFMNRTGLVIYLKMTPGQLQSRLKGRAASRPLISGKNNTELLQYISDKLLEREKYYLQASIIVDSIDLDINALCNLVRKYLDKCNGLKA